MYNRFHSDFFNGAEVSLFEMLSARETRVQNQWKLLNSRENTTLISATMNIPGPVKTNDVLENVFKLMIKVITHEVQDQPIFTTFYNKLKTGSEFYLLSALSPKDVKERLVKIEENHPFGRLFDLDVLFLTEEGLKSVSRVDLKLPTRRCLVCHLDAKDCGRTRRHDVSELQKAIMNIINEGRDLLHG